MKPTEEGGGGFSADGDETESEFVGTTLAQVEAQVETKVPRQRPRMAALEEVNALTRALDSAHLTPPHVIAVQRAAAAEAARNAEHALGREANREAAFDQVIESQAKRPPLSKKEWEAHIYSGLCPTFEYFFSRIVSGTQGDRFKLVEFFCGCRIFDPSRAKYLSRAEAFGLIEKLAYYPVFNVGGEESIISRLKHGWSAYHTCACCVVDNFVTTNNGINSHAAITTWHYRLFLRIECEKADDACCRYCPNKYKECACYDGLKVWWEACELAALVLPLSGSAERVISLSKSLFSIRQSCLLSDALKLALMLAFNNRGS